MAIDTREKRFSMLEFGGGYSWHTLFEADGAVDTDDRLHQLGLYSGITLDPPGVPEEILGGATRGERANRKLARKLDIRSRSVVGSGRSIGGRNLGRR